jgi:hypothetical protein
VVCSARKNKHKHESEYSLFSISKINIHLRNPVFLGDVYGGGRRKEIMQKPYDGFLRALAQRHIPSRLEFLEVLRGAWSNGRLTRGGEISISPPALG